MRAIVVGGGLAGFGAAIELARGGAEVELFEPRRLGGRARSEVRQGAAMNLGAHALYRSGATHRALAEWGARVHGRTPARGLYMLSDEGLLPLPTGAWSLATCRLLGWRERIELGQVLARPPAAEPGESALAYVDRLRGAESRRLFGAIARLTTYCGALDRLDASALVEQLRMAGKGVWYVDGGWQSIVDALEHLALAAGVQRVPERARGLERRDGRWVVRGDDRVASVDVVVLAVSPKVASSLAGASFALESATAATLDLVLGSLPRPDTRFVLDVTAPRYLSVHSAVARLGPPDRHVVHLVRYGQSTTAREELEALLDLSQPGWRDQVLDLRFRPRLTITHGFPSVDRARPAGPLAEGLFVAGDWVGPRAMLADAAMDSGRAAARQARAAHLARAA